MELTQAEARLINALREIDRVNPLGIDGYTEAAYIDMLSAPLPEAAAEAGRRYRLFMGERRQAPEDIAEARRPKSAFEDKRATAARKAEYERTYRRYNLPPPTWAADDAPGDPHQRSRVIKFPNCVNIE